MKINWLDRKLISFTSVFENTPPLCWAFALQQVWRSNGLKSECWISVDWCVWGGRGCRSGSRRFETEIPRVAGREWLEPGNKPYVHGNVPGHIDVGLVLIHPDLGGSQGVALGIVIYVIVVGLLGALDVSHSGTWEDLHTTAALPYLHSREKRHTNRFNKRTRKIWCIRLDRLCEFNAKQFTA